MLEAPSRRAAAPSICVGMSTYDDFDGVWFTIEAICLYHREVLPEISFVVIDNHPEGAASAPLQALEGYVARYRYVPFTGFRGTAVRDLVFREADADIVCCVDSHVLLRPGALAALQAWFAAHPDSPDLIQGPILWDDLRNGATHMEPTWREGMFGTWATDPRFGDPDAEPFEIPLHGLGLFACRRAAWPGINPRFRGFGGEEGYLQEKFRQRGGRVLCHPSVTWVHRFGRPAGPAYSNTWEDRIRNYVCGWSEVGWDLAPVEGHFRAFLGPQASLACQQARAQIEHPLSVFDGVFCVADESESCDAHGHPDGVAWRVERVLPQASGGRELRRMTAWRTAVSQAARRGYESVLLLDANTAAIDPAPVAELEHSWEVCLLRAAPSPGAEQREPSRALDGRAVALHQRAFARILADLPGDATEFAATWGDVDSYLLRRVADGALVATGVPFAHIAGERLAIATGLDALERDDGITIRQPSSPRVYDLNRTASMVLHLCDGTRTVADIAAELAGILTLETVPVAEVSTCVQQLRHAGILTANGSQGIR